MKRGYQTNKRTNERTNTSRDLLKFIYRYFLHTSPSVCRTDRTEQATLVSPRGTCSGCSTSLHTSGHSSRRVLNQTSTDTRSDPFLLKARMGIHMSPRGCEYRRRRRVDFTFKSQNNRHGQQRKAKKLNGR